MNNPQSLCKEIQKIKHLDAIEKYGCCAFVFMWCLGIDPTDITAIQTIDDLITTKVIDSECTVDWAKMGKALTGRDISVEFIDIKDLSGIRERTPVRFDYKGRQHWVGVEKGMIAFNSLSYSQCVDLGRPVTMRKLIIRGKK